MFSHVFLHRHIVKMLIHTLQKKRFFSLVCLCMYPLNSRCMESNEAHTAQEYGFTSVCFLMSFLKMLSLNMLIHILIKKMVSLQCLFAGEFLNEHVVKILILRYYKKIFSLQYVLACCASRE